MKVAQEYRGYTIWFHPEGYSTAFGVYPNIAAARWVIDGYLDEDGALGE